MNRLSTLAAGVMLAALVAPAVAEKTPPSIAAAVADPTRPAADRARDAERKPTDMLKFAGVKPGMTVFELLPGSGYFTRLFSSAVGPAGKVIADVPARMAAEHPQMLDKAQAIAADRSNVVIVHPPLDDIDHAGQVDLAWTSQNYHDLHNIPGVDVVAFNRAVFRSLKPGGVYIVLDHAAPEGSGLADTGTQHRIDPLIVRQEVQAAGFLFDGEDKALANPQDHRDLKVFDPAIRGHTDQFVFRFRKPM